MRIEPLDVDDDVQIQEFWEVGKASEEFERAYPTYWTQQAQTAILRAPDMPFEFECHTARVNDQAVGSVQIEFPRLENLHLAEIIVNVVPASRGRGVGTALLDHAIEVCRGRGRTTLVGMVCHPLEGGGRDLEFARRHGFEQALINKHRVLDLPVAADLLDELASKAEPHHNRYRLVHYDDVRPDEVAAGYANLMSTFHSEAPIGDLDIEDEVWDIDRVRQMEARFRNRGRHESGTVALAPDGTVVAASDLAIEDAKLTDAFQGATLVSKAHRGHRLGMAVKVANLRAMQQRFPEATAIHSWNADVNDHMIAINDALGFRAVESVSEVQRVIEPRSN